MLSLILKQFLKMPFYAVARGRSVGIYNTWAECQAQVYQFPRPIFRKFENKIEANNFLIANGCDIPKTKESTELENNKFVCDLQILGESQTDLPIENQLKIIAAQKRINSLQKQIIQLSNSNDSIDTNEIVTSYKRPGSNDLQNIETPLNKIIKLNTSTTVASTSITKQSSNEAAIIKLEKYGQYSFFQDTNGFVHVYTDGSCEGNGKKNARAGLGVYFAEGHALNTSRPVKGRATNNCGEIQASTLAIRLANENGINRLCINTDSQFLINAVTKWVSGWKARGWKLRDGKPVKNEIDFKELDRVMNMTKMMIKWNYVKAHCGILGNERADKLARDGAKMYS